MRKLDWKEVKIHTTHEAMESVSNILNEYGANGVLIKDSHDLLKEKSTNFGEIFELNPNKFPKEGVFITAYFADDTHFPEKFKQINEDILNLRQFDIDIGTGEISLDSVVETDWETSWKKYYKPTSITNKITIVPTWETYDRTHKDEIIVKLDPGMAFGTGTHETTMLSVKSLEKYVNQDDTVIDVGCGSGILSITALKLGAKQVYAYDLDSVAVNSTKINSQLNDVDNKMTIKQNDLLKDINVKSEIIVSNILAEILVDLISDANRCIIENGYLILSGIIKQKESLVTEQLETNGFSIVERNEMGHWVSLVAQKSV